MLLANLLAATVPSLVILWWLERRYRQISEPSRHIVILFALGTVAVGIAILLGLVADSLLSGLTGPATLIVETFVLAGLVEEGAKYIVILGYVRRNPGKPARALILLAIAVSLGFAFVENILYLGGPWRVLWLRGFLSVPLHCVTGGILGSFFARHQNHEFRTSLAGFGIAALVHGAFDFFLRFDSWYALGAVAIAVIGIPVVVTLYNRSRS